MEKFSYQCVGTLSAHKGPVLCAKFTHDGQYCMSTGSDKAIHLWNPHKLLNIKEYKGFHNNEICDISIFQNNAKFITVGGDKLAFMWDVSSGQVIRKFIGHRSALTSCNLNFNDSILCTTSSDHSVKLWDIKAFSKHPIQTLLPFSDTVTHSKLTNYEIICTSLDGSIRNFDIRKGCLYSDHLLSPIVRLSLSRDEDYILISCLDSCIRLIDKKSGQLICTYRGHKCLQYNIQTCFDPSDSFILSGSEDSNICVWDLLEGGDDISNNTTSINVDNYKFKNNDSYKNTQFLEKNADVSKLNNDTNKVFKLKEHKGIIFSLCFHPVNRILISTSSDKTVKVWKQLSE